jgi:hypothetical protein
MSQAANGISSGIEWSVDQRIVLQVNACQKGNSRTILQAGTLEERKSRLAR